MALKSISSTTAIVLITGGNQGIGLEIASVLADLPEYHIIIGSRNSENGAKALEGVLSDNPSRSVSTVEIDVTSDSSISSAAATIKKDFGRVDVLINNAGSLFEDPVTPVISRSIFQKTYEVNVFGAAIVTEAFLPLLEKCTVLPPRLIFISSRMGSLATRADPASHNNFPIYRSSKSALNMIMLHYAALYGKKGWKVNACAPGFTKVCSQTFFCPENMKLGANMK